MHWDYLTILFFMAVIVPWRSRVRVAALLQSHAVESRERIALYASTIAFQWTIALAIFWRCHARGLSFFELGLSVPQAARAVTAAIAISAVLVVNQVFGVLRLVRLPPAKRGIVGQLAERLVPRINTEKWIALALVLTVAFCEEFIYRGFIESLFQREFSSLAAGAVISAGLFSVAHAYQGRRGIITTFIVGLLFSSVRIWTSSLLPSVIIHFAVDLSAGIASARLLIPERAE